MDSKLQADADFLSDNLSIDSCCAQGHVAVT